MFSCSSTQVNAAIKQLFEQRPSVLRRSESIKRRQQQLDEHSLIDKNNEITFNTRSIVDDIWMTILFFINGQDVLSVCSSCKHFYQLICCEPQTSNYKMVNKYFYPMNKYWKRECINLNLCQDIDKDNFDCSIWYYFYKILKSFAIEYKRKYNRDIKNEYKKSLKLRNQAILLSIHQDNLLIFQMLTNIFITKTNAVYNNGIDNIYEYNINEIDDPNSNNKRTFSALFYAIQYESSNIVKYLLQCDPFIPFKNIDISCETIDEQLNISHSNTPLQYVCFHGNLEYAQLLLKHPRMDTKGVNKPSKIRGFSPLHNACVYGHSDIVSLLLKDKRTDVNVQCHDGSTPLMWMIVHKRWADQQIREKICLMLISHSKINLPSYGSAVMSLTSDPDDANIMKTIWQKLRSNRCYNF